MNQFEQDAIRDQVRGRYGKVAPADGEEEALNHYRRVRDEIKAYVQTLPGALA